MRALLWWSFVVALAWPRPADARPSLDGAAVALCKGDDRFDPHELLSQAGRRAVAPLMKVLARGCEGEAFPLVVDLLCEAQESVDGDRVTPAFAPVRAALASGDPHQVSLAIEILGALNGVVSHDVGLESSSRRTGPSPRCDGKAPILAAAAPLLARLLVQTRGARRDEAVQLVTRLDLAAVGARAAAARTLRACR